MKLVFLDFDGVINNQKRDIEPINKWRAFFSNKRNHILIVELLEKCYKENIRIVVSSTWRMAGLELIGSFFIKFGMERKKVREILKYSTSIHKHNKRGEEILEYLNEVNFDNKKDKFVIIDDDSYDITCFDELKQNFIYVDNMAGYTMKNLKETYEKLNIK